MIGIDTNVVARYLTGDHSDQSARARALIDGKPVFVPLTVLLEAEWVLRAAYGYTPADVVRALRGFGGLPTVTIEEDARAAQALDRAEAGMDFADALHLGKAAGCAGFASFDRRFLQAAAAAGCAAHAP